MVDIKSVKSDTVAADVLDVPFAGHLLLERPLLNKGTGFYARKKNGYLPRPSAPTRVASVQVR